MASKKLGISTLAGSPINFVLVAGTVRVQQDFISGFIVTHIDFGVGYEAVRAAEGN
jgi:hypothetical protein